VRDFAYLFILATKLYDISGLLWEMHYYLLELIFFRWFYFSCLINFKFLSIYLWKLLIIFASSASLSEKNLYCPTLGSFLFIFWHIAFNLSLIGCLFTEVTLFWHILMCYVVESTILELILGKLRLVLFYLDE